MHLVSNQLVRYTRTLCLIVILYLSSVISSAYAEVNVISKPESAATSLSLKDVRDLYYGRRRSLPDGSAAHIVDLPVGHPARIEFYKKIMRKSERQMRAYWAKRVFTGKGMPPKTLPNEEEVIRWVNDSKNVRIGYIGEVPETAHIKVLFSED